MSTLQNILTNVLPPTWADSMEAASRTWMMRCPCGHETSVWEMGGVRWGAAAVGKKTATQGRCAACGRTFVGEVYRRGSLPPVPIPQAVDTSASVAATSRQTRAAGETRIGERTQCLLWIDGVGCWLVCLRDSITVGGPALRPAADKGTLRLLADLSAEHATIQRSGESYLIRAEGGASIRGERVTRPTAVSNGDVITLGEAVRLRFAQPNPLSPTARLEFVSSHRPAIRLDGVVLMEDTLVLGPSPDCHIVCEEWEQTVLLFRRDGRLWCKSKEPLYANGCQVSGAGETTLREGAIVTGAELRFRVEFASDPG